MSGALEAGVDVKDQLLIVFTDELGSTTKDENEFKTVRSDPTRASEYKRSLISRRCQQFGMLVNKLLATDAFVVKNVGDALVITLCSKHGDPSLIKCLKALFEAWECLESTIRVAVHISPISALATGDALEPAGFLALLREYAPNFTEQDVQRMWPALGLIAYDVFGAPMNRAARLAGVPQGAQFVVSEEVAASLVSLPPPEKSWSDRVRAGRTKLEAEFNAVSDMVPLVRVRNVDGVTFNDPWWVIEIRPYGKPPALIHQFKSVQAIRVIEIAGDVLDDQNISAANNLINSWVGDSLSCATFFVDLVFVVRTAWAGHDIRRDRRHDKSLEVWTPRDANQRKRRAVYVVFSGCPDIATDESLRRARMAQSADDWRLEPTTLRVYQQIRYWFSDPGASLPIDKGYYLLEFQVKSGTVRPDSSRVFKDIKQKYLSGSLHTLGYGLLEGETDGFVLFHATGKTDEEITNFFVHSEGQPGAGEPSFLERIAVITLYALRLTYKNEQKHVWEALLSYNVFVPH